MLNVVYMCSTSPSVICDTLSHLAFLCDHHVETTHSTTSWCLTFQALEIVFRICDIYMHRDRTRSYPTCIKFIRLIHAWKYLLGKTHYYSCLCSKGYVIPWHFSQRLYKRNYLLCVGNCKYMYTYYIGHNIQCVHHIHVKTCNKTFSSSSLYILLGG